MIRDEDLNEMMSEAYVVLDESHDYHARLQAHRVLLLAKVVRESKQSLVRITKAPVVYEEELDTLQVHSEMRRRVAS